MKYGTFIFLLAILNSCQTKHDSFNNYSGEINELRTDTILLVHKRYYPPDESPDIFEYKLLREQMGDSFLSFRYYMDTALIRQYDFLIWSGQFKLIQDTTNSDHLILVDTFSIQLIGEELVIYKYELLLPPIDGDVGYLFNEKYGLLGYSSYSWGIKTILTNWNELDFENEVSEIILADNVKYLSRQNFPQSRPPLGHVRKNELLVDSIEMKLEDNEDEKIE